MATTRIIDCIGASDEHIAHLRLLLRTAKIHLRDIWHWGPETKADIVIVDRRRSSRRETVSSGGSQREVRDRRRARIPGELPDLAGD